MTGKWVRNLTSGTAEISSVFRTELSKPRTPRSTITMSLFPSLAMYSAASIHSSMVAAIPRFNWTGLGWRPTSRRRAWLDMFLVPTRSMSAYEPTRSTSLGSRTSATKGRPVVERASAMISRAAFPNPWNEYGEVRGLKASPLRMCAPDVLTATAVAKSCSRLSTAQGPAMTLTGPSPILTSPTTTTVLSDLF